MIVLRAQERRKEYARNAPQRRAGHCDSEAGGQRSEDRRVIRQHGITEATYYRWKAKFGGMDVSDAKKLKQLEEENRKLKHVVADLTLDNLALKDVLSKNW